MMLLEIGEVRMWMNEREMAPAAFICSLSTRGSSEYMHRLSDPVQGTRYASLSHQVNTLKNLRRRLCHSCWPAVVTFANLERYLMCVEVYPQHSLTRLHSLVY
ncbi:hypothetical protein AcV7_000237 [Taiwanofungus camphoratus]|nr:hypothetical protein AcV7_000237 [Antrodia cinnamomea]